MLQNFQSITLNIHTHTHKKSLTNKQYLECMRGVMDAVDAKAEVEGEAGCSGGE